MTPVRLSTKTIVGLQPVGLDNEPFELRPRLVPLNKPSDTWPSRPTPTDLPRACRLEVTAQIVRRQRASWAEFGLSCAIVWVVGCLLLTLVVP